MAMASGDGYDTDQRGSFFRKKRRLRTKTDPEECYDYAAFPLKPGVLTCRQLLKNKTMCCSTTDMLIDVYRHLLVGAKLYFEY